MPKKRKNNHKAQQWAEITAYVEGELPHLGRWLLDVDEFAELRLKARPDGTTLAIAKGYGDDGGPMVCFGVGYDVFQALMAVDSTIQGGNWRVDKPWGSQQ